MPAAGTTCAYYFSDAGHIYSDSAVKEHTRKMLRRFTSMIQTNHPEYGADWELVYLVTRVLDAVVLHKAALGVAGGKVEDDEDDEEDE
eukprot:gene11224-23467_t